MALADWFGESGAFAFDYSPEDPEVSEQVKTFAAIPWAEVAVLLNPQRTPPADARRLLCAAAYFVDLAVNYPGIVAPDDRRPGGLDSDLFQSARLIRRYVPNPLSL